MQIFTQNSDLHEGEGVGNEVAQKGGGPIQMDSKFDPIRSLFKSYLFRLKWITEPNPIR